MSLLAYLWWVHIIIEFCFFCCQLLMKLVCLKFDSSTKKILVWCHANPSWFSLSYIPHYHLIWSHLLQWMKLAFFIFYPTFISTGTFCYYCKTTLQSSQPVAPMRGVQHLELGLRANNWNDTGELPATLEGWEGLPSVKRHASIWIKREYPGNKYFFKKCFNKDDTSRASLQRSD